jgi:hypothetical protein
MDAYEKLGFERLNWKEFESLCVELLKAEGFANVKKLGRGATGGDLVADEPLPPSPSGRQEVVHWLVQCKHYAGSGKSVSLNELGVMTSVLRRHRAQGLLLITSTEPSGEASQALADFDQDESHQYKATWWDRLELCTRLMQHPELVGQFFGSEAKAWAIEKREGVNRERQLAGVVRELFKGRVRVVNEDLFQHPASEDEINDYYEGRSRLTWNVVAGQGIIERDQQVELLKRLATPFQRTQMICIVGEPGAGKSSLAWELIYKLARQQCNPVLQILDNTDDNIWYCMLDFWTRIQQPFYVLVDDVFLDEGVLLALKGLDPNLPLTLLATSRTNEYRGSERFPFPVARVDLIEPSPAEKTRILRKLDREWAQLTPQQRARLGAANQFLVVMMELTAGKGLTGVIRDTLNRLRQRDETVYRAYEYLCHIHQYDLSMPSSLLERLDEKGRFYRLLDRKAARGLVFPDELRPGNLQVGHPLIAEHAARLCGRDPCSVVGEMLEAVDVRSRIERGFAAHLLRRAAQRGIESRLLDILKLNAVMIEKIQREATVYEMSIWRTLYRNLGIQEEMERCVDMALGKEPETGRDCTALLALCRERGQEKEALPMFREWLADHPEDTSVRVCYLGLVERQGLAEQVAQVIEDTAAWLADHPQDNYIRAAYLGLAERQGLAEQVAQVIEDTAAWLADHPEDNYVRTAYLSLVRRRGMAEQKARAIKNTKSQLVHCPRGSTITALYLALISTTT